MRININGYSFPETDCVIEVDLTKISVYAKGYSLGSYVIANSEAIARKVFSDIMEEIMHEITIININDLLTIRQIRIGVE